MVLDIHFWTTDELEKKNLDPGQRWVEEQGFWSPKIDLPQTVPVYRLSNKGRQVHLWSTDRTEGNDQGYEVEGEAFRVFTAQDKHTVPLERWRGPAHNPEQILRPPLYFYTSNPANEVLGDYQFDRVMGYVYGQNPPDPKIALYCQYVFRYYRAGWAGA